MPLALLERRPDIAAAGRTMAAANVEIGVVVCSKRPSISFVHWVGGWSANQLPTEKQVLPFNPLKVG